MKGTLRVTMVKPQLFVTVGGVTRGGKHSDTDTQELDIEIEEVTPEVMANLAKSLRSFWEEWF